MMEEEEQMTPQQFQAEEERKLSMRRLIFIGLIIFVAIFYFVWSNYINFGYISVIGDSPFSVNIIGETRQECASTPCEIKLKRGDKLVSISKDGFTADSMNTEVILWDTVVIKPVFKLEPYIKEVTLVPAGAVTSTQTKYKFIYDKTHNNYAVVKDGDSVDFAISYFGGKLQSPFLIGSDNAVLVMENVANGKAFYIDAITEERSDIKKTFNSASRALPSPNGRYFLIENSAKTLLVADKKEFSQIRSQTSFENAFWTLKNTLVLAYLDREEDEEGNISERYIFEEYDPIAKESMTLFTSDSMIGDAIPKNIKVAPSTNTVFFESGDKKFEIIF